MSDSLHIYVETLTLRAPSCTKRVRLESVLIRLSYFPLRPELLPLKPGSHWFQVAQRVVCRQAAGVNQGVKSGLAPQFIDFSYSVGQAQVNTSCLTLLSPIIERLYLPSELSI